MFLKTKFGLDDRLSQNVPGEHQMSAQQLCERFLKSFFCLKSIGADMGFTKSLHSG